MVFIAVWGMGLSAMANTRSELNARILAETEYMIQTAFPILGLGACGDITSYGSFDCVDINGLLAVGAVTVNTTNEQHPMGTIDVAVIKVELENPVTGNEYAIEKFKKMIIGLGQEVYKVGVRSPHAVLVDLGEEASGRNNRGELGFLQAFYHSNSSWSGSLIIELKQISDTQFEIYIQAAG